MRAIFLAVVLFAPASGFAQQLDRNEAEQAIADLLKTSEKGDAAARRQAVAEFDKFLEYRYPEVRVAALAAIAKLEPKRAEQCLVETFEIAASSKMGGFYLQQVAKANPDAAIPPLVALLKDDPDRQWLARAGLGAVAEAALDELVGLLNDQDVRLRQAAAEIIGSSFTGSLRREEVTAKAEAAWQALVAALKDDAAEVRVQAAMSCVLLAGPQARRAAEVLAADYADVSDSMRRYALLNSRYLRPEMNLATPLLRKALKDPGPDLRVRAAGMAQAYRLIPHQELASVYIEALQYDGLFESGAMFAVGHPEHAGAALPKLKQRLESIEVEDVEARGVVAAAIASLDREQVAAMLPHIIAFIDSDDHYIRNRQEVLMRLGDFGEPAKPVLPVLRKLLTQKRLRSRASAALSLLRIAPQEPKLAIGVLRDALAGTKAAYDPLRLLERLPPAAEELVEEARASLRTSEKLQAIEFAAKFLGASRQDMTETAAAAKARSQQVEDPYLRRSLAAAAKQLAAGS